MSRCLNKAQLIGYVGRQPEIKEARSGATIANLSIGTTMQWRDESGERKESTEWHSLVAFGKVGDIVRNYVNMGDQLYIEGSLRTRNWEDQQGQKHYKTEIVIDQLIMLKSKVSQQSQVSQSQPRQQRAPAPPAGGFDDFGDSDIPF